ncbi:hypothetical protein ACGFIW_24165 [Micromonospora sp. NPDC048935]|uniref:hypothetical protein n=1 Tax=Micromonospora sp. NPDC048935 TaxID=3364262 RepID=UPI00371722B0
MNRETEYLFRVRLAGWGIYVKIQAGHYYPDEEPFSGAPLSGNVFLVVDEPHLDADDLEMIRLGVLDVASDIESLKPGATVVVVVSSVTLVLTQYQPEGLRAAMIGWANEHFGLGHPMPEVVYTPASDRYEFSFSHA